MPPSVVATIPANSLVAYDEGGYLVGNNCNISGISMRLSGHCTESDFSLSPLGLYLSAPNGSNVISPITSILTSIKTMGAENLTKSAFGLPSQSDLFADPHSSCQSPVSCLHLIAEVSTGSLISLISCLFLNPESQFESIAPHAVVAVAHTISMLDNTTIDSPPPQSDTPPQSDSPPPSSIQGGRHILYSSADPPPLPSSPSLLDFSDPGYVSQVILLTAYLALTSANPVNISLGPVIDPTVLSAASAAISNVMTSIKTATSRVDVARSAFVGRTLVSDLLSQLGSKSSAATFHSSTAGGSSFISSFSDATSLGAILRAINETNLAAFTPSPPPNPSPNLSSPAPPSPPVPEQGGNSNEGTNWMTSHVWAIVVIAAFVFLLLTVVIAFLVKWCLVNPSASTFRPQLVELTPPTNIPQRQLSDNNSGRGQSKTDLPTSPNPSSQNHLHRKSFTFSSGEGQHSDAYITVRESVQNESGTIPIPPMALSERQAPITPWISNSIFNQSRGNSSVIMTPTIQPPSPPQIETGSKGRRDGHMISGAGSQPLSPVILQALARVVLSAKRQHND